MSYSDAVVQRCSVKKCVLRNFAKFTGKHLCQSLFACNFIKKETLTFKLNVNGDLNHSVQHLNF